mmetsp:Transcript_45694/g.138847  ORF Transcript_45694/g.138847 Transcript_45694/m.138847 type:complete len:224 (-) Transcript_45694:1157-1828(-)
MQATMIYMIQCNVLVLRTPHLVERILQISQPYVRHICCGVGRICHLVPLNGHAPHDPVVPVVQNLYVRRIPRRDELQHFHPPFAASGERIRPDAVGETRPVRPDDGRCAAEDVELLLVRESLPVLVAPREVHQFLCPAVTFHGPHDRNHDIPLVVRVEDAAMSGQSRRVSIVEVLLEIGDGPPGIIHNCPLLVGIPLRVILRDPSPEIPPQRVPVASHHVGLV